MDTVTTDEPTLEDIAKEHTGWIVWRGIAGLCYGRLRLSSPPVVVRAEDPLDLRDMIRREVARLEARRWSGTL